MHFLDVDVMLGGLESLRKCVSDHIQPKFKFLRAFALWHIPLCSTDDLVVLSTQDMKMLE